MQAQNGLNMQYQVFLQNQAEQRFVASVLGIPNLSVEGSTEAEAIARIKIALESQLKTGKLITLEVGAVENLADPSVQVPHAGIFANDPTFDDWMEKLAAIRQNANTAADVE
jgi:predicted RNase H-like HicB family nuclease